MDVIRQTTSQSFDAEDPVPEKESRGGQWAPLVVFWGLESEVLVSDTFFFFFFFFSAI